MKVSRAQAEENRRNVIDVSSRLFRQNGFDGVGVNTLMQAAGLTHGGFYKQFKSKDDLIGQAIGLALDQTKGRLTALAGKSAPASFETIVRYYLSERHRDAMGEGCALAALGADVARHGPDVRRVVERSIEDYLGLLEAAIGAAPDRSARNKAIAALSMMVGALVLSRAVEDRDLSGQILVAAADALLPGAEGAGPAGERVR